RKNRDMGLLLLGSSDELRRNVGFMDFNFHFMQLCRKMGIRHQTEWFSPQEQPDKLPGLLTEGLVGGAIIAGEPYGAVRDHLAGGNALPYVRLDGSDGYCVCFDWKNALSCSVRSLFQLGHRRIAMLNGFEHYQIYQDARRGYLQGLKENGLPGEKKLYWAPASEFLLTERVQHGMKYLFEQKNPPTAVLAGGGLLVKSVVSWLQQKGYRVPQDVSVAAFGAANWEALNFIPVLSAVEYDYELAAKECVRLLGLLMDNGSENRPERVLIKLGGLTLRESTARRPGSAKTVKGVSG
ncbi:MAG: substrate-binding domain-containing protein, partial [Victivallales bacterium]